MMSTLVLLSVASALGAFLYANNYLEIIQEPVSAVEETAVSLEERLAFVSRLRREYAQPGDVIVLAQRAKDCGESVPVIESFTTIVDGDLTVAEVGTRLAEEMEASEMNLQLFVVDFLDGVTAIEDLTETMKSLEDKYKAPDEMVYLQYSD